MTVIIRACFDILIAKAVIYFVQCYTERVKQLSLTSVVTLYIISNLCFNWDMIMYHVTIAKVCQYVGLYVFYAMCSSDNMPCVNIFKYSQQFEVHASSFKVKNQLSLIVEFFNFPIHYMIHIRTQHFFIQLNVGNICIVL